MKVLYIQSKYKGNLDVQLSKQELSKLPENLFLAYSIQYKGLAESIKKQLESNHVKIDKFQQVLGCSNVNTALPILLIGSGRFHAQNLMLQAREGLYVLENNKIVKISDKEIQELKAKRKTALIKYLRADKIGILVSTKPGQENLNQAIKLKEKIEKQNNQKQAFIFMSNNIDVSQFENFNIESWVNTACSGLSMDNFNIININEIKN
ncbi:MAG: diphthamide synthesis protein [Nanoarchaeota archaeon]